MTNNGHSEKCSINYGFPYCNCDRDFSTPFEYNRAVNGVNNSNAKEDILVALKELRNKLDQGSTWIFSDESYYVPVSYIDKCFEEMKEKYK